MSARLQGYVSKTAAQKVKAREDTRLEISKRLQVELRMRPGNANSIALSIAKQLIAAGHTAEEVNRSEMRTMARDVLRKRRQSKARFEAARPTSTDARSESKGTHVDATDIAEAVVVEQAEGRPLELSRGDLPPPKSRLRHSKQDMWSGLSRLEESIAELEQVARVVDGKNKMITYSQGLNDQRMQLQQYRRAAAEREAETLRAAQEASASRSSGADEAKRRREARARKFHDDVKVMHEQLRRDKAEQARLEKEQVLADLNRVNREAKMDRVLTQARRKALRTELAQTKAANFLALKEKERMKKELERQDMEQMAQADAERDAREARRTLAMQQKQNELMRKLKAMGGVFEASAAAEKAAAEKAEREQQRRHDIDDAAALAKAKHRKALLAEERVILFRQMREHEEARKQERREGQTQRRKAAALAQAANEEESTKKERALQTKRRLASELVQQMQATAKRAVAPDDSLLERRFNNKLVKLKRAELEARAAEILSKSPDSLLRGSAVVDRIRRQAERLEAFGPESSTRLSDSARGIMAKLDQTMARFTSPVKSAPGAYSK